MQNITGIQTGALPQAKPAAAVRAKSESRLAYIDTTKMILTILVILVHAAITYGAFGDWTYHDTTLPEDEASAIVLSLFIFICQSFFMGLFFFYAGLFTPGSYDRKGPARFWKERLVRIGIPMLLYTYLLSRVPNFIDETANGGLRLSFWEYTSTTWLSDADGGPTWFLFALLAFSLGYTLWRAATRRLDLSWSCRLPVPGTRSLLLAGLAVSAAMFTIAQRIAIPQDYDAFGAFNLLFAFFPGYILMFTGGILASRSRWLEQVPASLLKTWRWISLGLIAGLPVFMVAAGVFDHGIEILLSGLTWQCAGTCLWFGCSSIAHSVTLTLWMRSRIQPQNKITALAGPNTFTVYLIHPLVLVPLSYALSFVDLPALVKFALASLLTVTLGYAMAEGLRRLPGARAVL